MAHTIFYSWQKDTPGEIGFDLVGNALSDAVNEINSDYSIERAPRELKVDRDTKDVSGQPAIVDTIFRKIEGASVFVPDMTVVGTRSDGTRGMQNPNVLIEYGYAVKALGKEHIVAVMNSHYGAASDSNIPFDMKHLRWPIQYDCPPDAGPAVRKAVRKQLAKDFKKALAAVIATKGGAPSLPRFSPRGAGESTGRFRTAGTPLGVTYDPMDSSAPVEKIFLNAGPVVWFRIYPDIDPGRQWTFNEIQTIGRENINSLRPFKWSGDMGFLRAQDGFGIRAIRRDSTSTTNFASFAFTNGEVWACAAGIVGAAEFRGRKIIPPMHAEFIFCLENYAAFLTNLGITGPFRWQAGMEGTDGLSMVTPGFVGEGGFSHTCLELMIIGSGSYVLGDNAIEALRPYFAKLYDSCGLQPPEVQPVLE